MFSQKQNVVVRLFDRLAKPASTCCYPEAERLIADRTKRALNATDTPDDLSTNDDSYVADDDTWVE
jgi:hypothetical protein